jgi:hypothetical protein
MMRKVLALPWACKKSVCEIWSWISRPMIKTVNKRKKKQTIVSRQDFEPISDVSVFRKLSLWAIDFIIAYYEDCLSDGHYI